MAINKNFVIKNGVEVNTNLLVGDSTLNKVGIATTVPGYTLHIGVGDGARGGIGATDITVTGIATIGVANSTSAALSVTGISTFEGLVDANGGVSARTAAVQDLTDNRVVIAGSGGELEDSANLTFDGSTLTVSGDLDPTNVSIGSTLQVAGVATFLSGVLVSGIGTFESDILPASDGAVDLGSSSKEFQDLFIDGTANIDSLAADTAAIGDLTENRVVIAGSGGELEDDGNLTFDGAMLKVGTAATVAVNGNAAFAGIVTVGGNLNVTGDYSVDEISARNLNLTGIATIPTLGVTGIGTFEKLTVGTGVTLQEHGGVSIAGVTTIGDQLKLGGNINITKGSPIIQFNDDDDKSKWLKNPGSSSDHCDYNPFGYKDKCAYGIVFNTDKHDGGGKHWMSMYINTETKVILFFDSAVTYTHLHPEIVDFIDNVKKQYKDIDFTFKYNKIQHQQSNSECGMYSIYFILTMLDSDESKDHNSLETFNKYFNSTDKTISDKLMVLYRTQLFRSECDCN